MAGDVKGATEKINVFEAADDVEGAINGLASGDLVSMGKAAGQLSKMSMGDLKSAMPTNEELAEQARNKALKMG
jgi:hypothetical protein